MIQCFCTYTHTRVIFILKYKFGNICLISKAMYAQWVSKIFWIWCTPRKEQNLDLLPLRFSFLNQFLIFNPYFLFINLLVKYLKEIGGNLCYIRR